MNFVLLHYITRCIPCTYTYVYIRRYISLQGVAPYLISPLMGIQSMGVSVQWALGCDVACTDSSGFSTAVQTAKTADIVVMVVGLDQGQER